MTAPVNHKLARDEFARRLRKQMFDKRIGAETLAPKAGLTVRLLRKYMAADSAPLDYFGDPTSNALKLAEALNVPIDDLVPPRPRSDDPDLLPAA